MGWTQTQLLCGTTVGSVAGLPVSPRMLQSWLHMGWHHRPGTCGGPGLVAALNALEKRMLFLHSGSTAVAGQGVPAKVLILRFQPGGLTAGRRGAGLLVSGE